MKALILYLDFTAASAANAAMQNSADRPDISVQWHIRPWRVDMLKYPSTAKKSLIDATDAHLIVIAGHCAHEAPFSLLRWLESWAGNRQVENAALAAIGCQEGDSLATQIVPELCQFARQHGLGLITDGAAMLESEFSPLGRDPSEPDFTPPLILPHLNRTTHLERYRGWGINE